MCPAPSAWLKCPNSDLYTHSVDFLKTKLEGKIPQCDTAQSSLCQQRAPAETLATWAEKMTARECLSLEGVRQRFLPEGFSAVLTTEPKDAKAKSQPISYFPKFHDLLQRFAIIIIIICRGA